MRLAAIEPQDIKAFAAHLAARGVRRNTVRLALAPVKLLLATAFEEGKIRSNPAARIRIAVPQRHDLEAEDSESAKALTEAELQALLDEIPPEWRLFFWFLADTGLRRSEVVEVRWKDMDLGGRLLDVRRSWDGQGRIGPPKSRYGRRTLRLTPELTRALWELRKATRGGDDSLVFTSERGCRIDYSNLANCVLRPAARRAGLGQVSFHTFRHTCASVLFRRGWNAVQVQRWLGHHSPAFTLATYVHLVPEDIPEAISAVGHVETSAAAPYHLERRVTETVP